MRSPLEGRLEKTARPHTSLHSDAVVDALVCYTDSSKSPRNFITQYIPTIRKYTPSMHLVTRCNAGDMTHSNKIRRKL